MSASKPFLDVAVGVMINSDGEILLAQRPEDKSWPGWWEFPGGKIESGETAKDALIRELKEELDVTVTAATPWVKFDYEYPKTKVRLAFFLVTAWDGEPQGLEQQLFAWTRVEKAAALGNLLPASLPPLQWLSLPPLYSITPDLNPECAAEELTTYLEQALAKGVRLFQFRQPNWPKGSACKELKVIFDGFMAQCHQHGVKLLVNSIHPRNWWTAADGVQLRATDAIALEERPIPEDKLLGISTHHLADILYAQILKADFLVLGHIKETASHPEVEPLGWEEFASLAEQAARPVYAIGGLKPNDLNIARQYHAHGVAGISAF
ncbi:MAG: Nudix family hydrolase [Alcaligenaceae bacterium]|jgi:8-oxo-dGTP diphosphatase|nr:Nudix family hydrolase [Alcaligenaceae bacterium]